MQYTFLFTAHYYNDDISKLSKECGLVVAEDFQKAMAQIESFYGKDLAEISIEVYDTPVPVFPLEMKETIKKALEGEL